MTAARKLAKLFRDPKAFFADARVFSSAPPPRPPSKNSIAINADDLAPDYDVPTGRHVIAYIPWQATHGDRVIKAIPPSEKFCFMPLRTGFQSPVKNRQALLKFARRRPMAYRNLMLKHLVSLKGRISAFAVTFDWHPSMQYIVRCCQELNIPVILIPHESVFLDKEKFYWFEDTGMRVPQADHLLVWGDMQRDIFLSRGIPEDIIEVVGSPKLDAYHDYRPSLTREEYCSIYTLDPNRPVLVYAMQLMDRQIDQSEGLSVQDRSIHDVMDLCDKHGYQLIVREPPHSQDVMSPELRARLQGSSSVFIDVRMDCLTTPEETIHHCDAMLSINSTMLFEAALAGRKAISLRYFDFDDLWTAVGIPSVRDAKELAALLPAYLREHGNRVQNLQWAANQFSNGTFEGKGAENVRVAIERILSRYEKEPYRYSKNDIFSGRKKFAEFAACAMDGVDEELARRLEKIAGVNHLKMPATVAQAATCRKYIQWGLRDSETRRDVFARMRKLGMKPFIITEAPLLANVGGDCLAYSLGGATAYYDSIGVSHAEAVLLSDRTYSEAELERSRQIITAFTELNFGRAAQLPADMQRDAVVVINQRSDDERLALGQTDGSALARLLGQSAREHPEAPIIVLNDFASGSGAIDPAIITDLGHRVQVVSADQACLAFGRAIAVYTATSDLGFEAALRGLPVTTCGISFYSGWGFTRDTHRQMRRATERSVEEVFHAHCIDACRYYAPDNKKVSSPEGLARYLTSYQRKNAA